MRKEATLPRASAAAREPSATPPASTGATAPPVVAPPRGHPRFPLLDSLRALAALAVLLSHAVFVSSGPGGPHAWWTPLFTNGVQGVTVFFVISGFLLYRPFLSAQLTGAPSTRVRDYFRRRVLRIVPAYWLALTLLAIYPGLAGVFTDDWWKYYFLLSGYSDATISHGLLVSWSLGVEVTFYFALPFYALLMHRLTRRLAPTRRRTIELGTLAVLALASMLLRYLDYRSARSAAVENSLPAFLYWFALGMALALLSVEVQRGARLGVVALVARRPWLCWLGAFLAYGLLCVMHGTDARYSTVQWVLGYYLLGGLASLLLVAPAVLGDRAGGRPRRVLALPVLAWLGLISYGIYLWHVPIVVNLYDRGIRGFVALAASVTAVSVLCAAASYYLVERPILRFK